MNRDASKVRQLHFLKHGGSFAQGAEVGETTGAAATQSLFTMTRECGAEYVPRKARVNHWRRGRVTPAGEYCVSRIGELVQVRTNAADQHIITVKH